jgi:cytochrome b561
MIIIDPSSYIACRSAEQIRADRNRPEAEDEFYRTHASNGFLRAATALMRLTAALKTLSSGYRREEKHVRRKAAGCGSYRSDDEACSPCA